MKLSRSRERSDRHRTHRVNQTGRAVSGLQLPKFPTIRPLIETRCKREWIQGRRGGGRMRRGSGRRPRSVSTRGARTGGNRRSNVPRALCVGEPSILEQFPPPRGPYEIQQSAAQRFVVSVPAVVLRE